MTRRTKKQDIRLVVGGEARAELLPPEVAARAQVRSTRRALIGVVVIGVLVCGGGYGFASLLAASSQVDLAVAQARTTALLREQTEFIEVSQVERQLAAAAAAHQIGTSTEIDWKPYMDAVQQTLPTGVFVVAFSTQSATPLQPYEQSSAPLEGERIATVIFTAVSADLPQVEQWLDSLTGLVGFADATPGSVSLDENGAYSVTIQMNINSDAYSGRFVPEAEESPEDEESE